MALVKKTCLLDQSSVDSISADIQAYLNTLGMERRTVQKIRLTAEEVLLNILEHCEKGCRINFAIGKQFGRHMLRLSYGGEPFDPVQSNGNISFEDMMRNLGYLPAWNYRQRENTVSLVLAEKKRRNMFFYLAIAILAAVLLGLAGNYIPKEIRQIHDDVLLLPLAQAFLGLMSTFSGLMIALTICSGILGIGDSGSFGQMGKRILLRFTGYSFLVCVLVFAFAITVLDLPFSVFSRSGSSQSRQISQMIFSILPSNLISPLQAGNTLQIIVIAVFAGVGLIAIGERGKHIRDLVNEGTSLTQHTVSLISGLIPLFVFVMLLRLIWSGDTAGLLSVWKPLVLILGSEVILAIAFLLITSLRLKCPPMTLLRKVFPPFAIAFTTASSLASMPLSMETCEKKLGIRKNLVYFAYPIGSVVYMPASIVSFTVIVCFFAEQYQVNINLSWLIMGVISITLLVIAMPPIPGAGLLVYTVLFAQMGIPENALALAAAIDVAVDFCNTGFNVLLLNLQVAAAAASQKRINSDILLS